MYAPNTNGILGDTARALSPELAYQIGQYFKENKVKNQQDNGNRPEEQSLQHLMAHAILGAATSYATGNNIATGALSGATSEKTAPILASYLYGKDPKELSQEQKDTITSIISLGTAGMAYGATGDVGSAVNASEVGKGGVENNTLKKSDADELLRQIAYARRHYDGAKLDEEMRRIRSLSAKLANENFKEIQACQNNPTPSCVNKIKSEYKDVNFAGLQDAYREYQGTHTILSGYESRNNSLLSCADTNFADCIIAADGKKVMLEGAYAAIGGGIGKGVGTSAQQVKQIKSQGGSKTRVGHEPDNDLFSNRVSGKIEYNPYSQYSGGLVTVNKPDPDADKLAVRLGGVPRVRFKNSDREFDAISLQYVAQAKPSNYKFNKSGRDQAKATFEAARDNGKSVYYHFNGSAHPDTVRKLNEYSKHYGIKVVIDTNPF